MHHLNPLSPQVILLFVCMRTIASAETPMPPPHRPAAGDVERALDSLGLTLNDVRIRRTDLDRLTNGHPIGSLQAYLFDQPFTSRPYAIYVRESLMEELKSPEPLKADSAFWKDIEGFDSANVARPLKETALPMVLSQLSRWMDHVVRRTLLGNPIEADMDQAAADDGLVEAVAALHQRAAVPLDDAAKKGLVERVRALPKAMQRAAALVLFVSARSMDARDRAIRKFDRPALTDEATLAERLEFDGPDGMPSDASRDMLEQFEVRPMIAAAQELAMAVQSAATLLRGAKMSSDDFTWQTPYGQIRLNAGGATEYDAASSYLLIIDSAGDDRYASGGNAIGLDNPVSVLIDLAGDDRYVAEHDPVTPRDASAPPPDKDLPPPHQKLTAAFGAGVLGVGILYDAAGDDRYDAAQRTMGYGLYGIGLLADLAGDDQYAAVENAQAAAQCGMGVLVDVAGNDAYSCYTQGQAFGYVGGLGCLLDGGGNDRYTANPGDVRYPSPQSKDTNTSMTQGAGYGHRADYLDGNSYRGGVGILLDAGGDDAYECGVFGQGCGYWMGVGMCIDGGGNDRYRGAWYVQGAAAHFAAGVLIDEAGDDVYEATKATSLGTGHDLSLGFLADLAGDDHYASAGLMMGSGNASGIGILIDAAGDDHYTVQPDNTLGNANPEAGIRKPIMTFGLFLDAGGHDEYSQSYAGDDRVWGNGEKRVLHRFDAPRYGIGLDTSLTPQQLDRLWAPPMMR